LNNIFYLFNFTVWWSSR